MELSDNLLCLNYLSQGMTLLHWTCDRGNLEMLNALLKLSADPNIQVYFAFNDFFYAPEIKDKRAFCFCPVCHSVWNFYLAKNFWTVKARALIFLMGIPSGKTFQRVPTFFTLWPWPLSLTFLAHLRWKLKWAFLIAFRPWSVCPSVCLSVCL